MIECPHGSDPATCPVCRGPAPKPKTPVEATTTAHFDGTCPACGDTIYAGQAIRRSTDGWVHDPWCA